MSRKPQQLNIQPRKQRPPSSKDKQRFPKNPSHFPCPVCGDSDFEWGYLQGRVLYSAEKTMLMSGEALRARLCRSCGNVLTFLNDV